MGFVDLCKEALCFVPQGFIASMLIWMIESTHSSKSIGYILLGCLLKEARHNKYDMYSIVHMYTKSRDCLNILLKYFT